MGYFNLNSGKIHDIYIDKLTENTGVEVIHLTVDSEYHQVKYRISGDANYSLNHIEKRLLDVKDLVLNADNDLKITENLQSSYIYVTYPDGSLEKYTAKRLS